MSDEVKVSVSELAIERVTPMSLIEMAVSQKADIGQLERLLDLQLRWEANEAKKAYSAAMNAFKQEQIDIVKNKTVSYESRGATVTYKHATLDNACSEITGPLGKHGISHRWKMSQANGKIKVICVLTHFLGHSEDTELEASPDDTGGKNSIQAISSTVTYLERYTLLAATGLAPKDEDNDGQGAPQWDKLGEFLDSISTAPNLKVLEATYKGAVKEAMAAGNKHAMMALVKCKDARKEQLAKEEA